MYNICKIMGNNESGAKRKVNSTKGPHEETGEMSHCQINTSERYRIKRSKHTQK